MSSVESRSGTAPGAREAGEFSDKERVMVGMEDGGCWIKPEQKKKVEVCN